MKNKLVFSCIIFMVGISSCQKCVTCVPYYLAHNGTVQPAGVLTQSVKLCDKIDIDAYEHGTTFQDNQKDSVWFVCK